MSSMVYENPLFFKDLSPIEIEYHNENPFIEYENKELSNPTIFKNLHGVTLREAKRITVMEPECVAMLFTYSSLVELDEDISGDAILYSSGYETISAGSSALYKYHFFLKKKQEGIPESFWYATYEKDYQGEYDYVSFTIPQDNLDKIREKIDNLNDNLNNNLENNKPDYSGYWTYMYNDAAQGQSGLTNYGVEFYFYVWESMNGPWFTRYGTQPNLIPTIENLATENGDINLPGGNADYTNPVGMGWPDIRDDGIRLFTLNYTSDFTADTSSNFVKIFRVTPNAQTFPNAPKIHMMSPKFSRFYGLWTYRYVNCGNIVIHDMGSNTVEGQERTIPMGGVPPLFTPGINIGQKDVTNVTDWNWDYLNFASWGTNINNFAVLDVERIFKPKRPPVLRYFNQTIKITIPEKDIEDLSRNFIDRYKPDRPAPRYKTWEGDIYIHPYEDNEIIKCWYNIHVFENTTEHPIMLENGSTSIIPNVINMEIPGETIICEFFYDTEKFPQYQTISIQDTELKTITEFKKGNTYIISIKKPEFQLYPLRFSLTEDGTNIPNTYEYKYNITYSGTQGMNSGNITINVTYDFPDTLYFYLVGLVQQGNKIDITSNLDTTRDYSIIPYRDTYNKILSDDEVDISDNLIYLETIEDCNFDYYDVPFDQRGELAYKKKDASGNLLYDASGNTISANILVNDQALAEQRTKDEPEWFAYEEYTPENTQILRSYLEDYINIPRFAHILDVPPGAGWFIRYKRNKLLPESKHFYYTMQSNVYYVRWSYSYRKYHYNKTDFTNPSLLSYEDVSQNTGISPSANFDFTDYGKIYEPKQVIFTYSNIEYPDKPLKYYKNLNISVNPDELMDLSKNVVYNTDLGCSISLQIYVRKPKNRMDRDQQNPIMDLSAAAFDTYDLSFNLPAYPNRFPSSISIDISDNGIKETTLLPGRYIAIWSYDVIHSFINPQARSYPLLPGIDYDASANSFDIGYNDFLYDNIEPIFQVPHDLSRMTLEISGIDISGILNMRDTYFHTLSDETEIKFNFLLWSPNYEWTQLLSGNRRWELPHDFAGEDDIRIKQVPSEYMDVTGLISLQKCFLGNDNSDSVGAIYNWGFGGEPGIQYRKVTYHDISNNEVYNRKQFIDIDTSNNAVEIDSSYWIDPSSVNFMIDFYLPPSDMSKNSAHWGFGSGPMDVLTFDEGSFHVGINSNGIDDIDIETGLESGLPVQQLGFIYKPPYATTNTIDYRYKYRFEANKAYKVRYKFQECHIYGQDVTRDVTISVNDELIYDIPGGGIQISDIKWLGQTYDVSNSPIDSRPYRIEVWYMDDVSSKTILKDLSNTTLVQNTLVPQDFDINDTETAFYESQNYETRGLYIPYISRWEYEIFDPCSNVIVKSSILKTEYPNIVNRLADWRVVQRLEGGEEFEITPEYPFEHKYYYAKLYTIPEEFIPPVPFYPTQYLDVSYNVGTRDLVVTFDKDKIVYPLMYNLLDYWKLQKSETEVKYLIYVWYPNSEKLPVNYSGPEDIASFNLWDDVYDMSFNVTSSSPFEMTNILPKIPHNVFKIAETELIFGKWVLAWNYYVSNFDFDEDIKSMPDYGFFDVSAVEINVPPVLYSPKMPEFTYIDDPSTNQILKIEIPEIQLINLENNITTQLKGLQDVSSVEITFYLWTPNKEITHDPSGWKLPTDYYGENDQRVYAYPVVYVDPTTNLYDAYYEEEQIGFDISKAFIKKLEKTNNNEYKDLSCVYFSHSEIFPEGNGHLPYSDVYMKNEQPIPYIARWSYEIKRNVLPSYYSDISSNAYYRNYEWNILEASNGERLIQDYDKIARYNYATLFTLKPPDPPTIVVLTDGACSCPENESKITKTQEALNTAMRNKIILENFRYAKRLRGRPLAKDPRAIRYVRQTGNTNVVFKLADNSTCPDYTFMNLRNNNTNNNCSIL